MLLDVVNDDEVLPGQFIEVHCAAVQWKSLAPLVTLNAGQIFLCRPPIEKVLALDSLWYTNTEALKVETKGLLFNCFDEI